jgi:hypothetical protein
MISFVKNYFTYLGESLDLCNKLESRTVIEIRKDNHKVSLANAYIKVQEEIENLDIPERYKKKLIKRLDFCYTECVVPKYRKYVAVL